MLLEFTISKTKYDILIPNETKIISVALIALPRFTLPLWLFQQERHAHAPPFGGVPKKQDLNISLPSRPGEFDSEI